MSRRQPRPRVVVLAGGLSHERDVSLRSGRRVAEALRDTGVDVEVLRHRCRPAPARSRPTAGLVVPLLHGETGEDGARAGGPRAARAALRRLPPAAEPDGVRQAVAKAVVARAGRRDTRRASRCRRDVPRARRGRGDGRDRRPARPAADGEAGPRRLLARVHGGAATPATARRDGGLLRVRRHRAGRAVRDRHRGRRVRRRHRRRARAPARRRDRPRRRLLRLRRALHRRHDRVLRARPAVGRVAARCAHAAVTAHRALGLRDLSRTDIIVDADGRRGSSRSTSRRG